jgi:rhamnulose-1-phosphate aldolase
LAAADSAAEPRPFATAYAGLAGRSFLVTGTGRRFRDMPKDIARHACILQIGASGGDWRLLWGGDRSPTFRPTSEFPTHLRVHEFLRCTNSTHRAVLHTHPTELIALTHLPEYHHETEFNDSLWRMHPEARVAVARGVGFVPYVLPGSEELALATVEALAKGHDVAMWAMHGCVAVGPDAMAAFDAIDTLNKAATLLLLCLAAGHRPMGLTLRHLDDLKTAFNLPAAK